MFRSNREWENRQKDRRSKKIERYFEASATEKRLYDIFNDAVWYIGEKSLRMEYDFGSTDYGTISCQVVGHFKLFEDTSKYEQKAKSMILSKLRDNDLPTPRIIISTVFT